MGSQEAAGIIEVGLEGGACVREAWVLAVGGPWEPAYSVVSLVSCQCPARLSDSENEEPSRGKMIQTHRSAFVSRAAPTP